MQVVFDADDDAKWITIHPNGSSKGRHVKVNGEGEIVAGNKHLVAALSGEGGADKHTDKNVKGVASAPLLDAVGETFTPLEEDGFDGIFDEFKPPQEEDFTSLLDDDVGVEQKSDDGVDKELTTGKVTLDGKEITIGVGWEASVKPPSTLVDYLKSKPGSSWSDPYKSNPYTMASRIMKGTVDLDELKKYLGEESNNEEPELVKAMRERLEYVKALRANAGSIADEVKKINDAESEKVVNGTFLAVSSHDCSLQGWVKHISKEKLRWKMKYLACSIKDFTTRFPNAQLTEQMRKTIFVTKDIYANKNAYGVSSFWQNHIAVTSDCFEVSATRFHIDTNPFAVSPMHGGPVPYASYAGYYPPGSEFYGVFIHEMAHQFYNSHGDAFDVCLNTAIKQNHFSAKYVTTYGCKNRLELHSEIVATVASPMYIQGSLPEAIEEYVYERVLGCKPGTWKKRESLWK